MINLDNPSVTYRNCKEQNYEIKTIQLNSPLLHIGGEVSRLNPYEYVQTSSKIYLPNQELLAKILYRRGQNFLNDYINAIETKQSIEILLTQALGENWMKFKTSDGIPLFSDVRPKWTLDEMQRVSDIRPMIRNGFGKLYIPGSSIKGAIRTAIAYYLLAQADEYNLSQSYQLSAIEEKLREKINQELEKNKNKPKNKNKISNKMKSSLDDDLFMNNLLTNYSLQYKGKNIPTKNNQSTDILRAIKISDSQPLKTYIPRKNIKKRPKNVPVIAETIISSYFPDNNAKYKGPIFAEVVYQVKTEFTIKLDLEMLSWFHHKQKMRIPFESIDDLLNICQEFAQKQWDEEIKYWQNISNNQDKYKNLDFDLIWDKYDSHIKCPYDLRLGWGSGMMGTTINSLFPNDLRSTIRDVCGREAPNFDAPKSRRTIVNSKQEIRYVPGWVNLTVK
jgi:CRISPR-associated protein Csm5